MTNIDLLQEAVNAGIINLDSVQEQIEMKKKETILKEHPYSIWEGKDGKWRTYVFDETKAKNRRLIKRKTKEDIEDFIVKFYNKNAKIEGITLEELFPKWIKYKYLHTTSSSYIKKITDDWKKYYKDDPIVKIPIENITAMDFDKWVHSKIKEYDMTKKMYYNMSIILRQGLQYAEADSLIKKNVFADVKVNSKMFRKTRKKEDETQVFLIDEQTKIIQRAFTDFYQNEDSTIALAIALNFQLGLRVGELVALRFSDIHGKYLSVSHEEVRDYDLSNPLKPEFIGYKIIDKTKTDAGFRDVYLTEEARNILRIVKEYNDEHHQHDDDFIFLHNGKRCPEYLINKRLKKYCHELNIMVKFSHKIRKTYISTLIDSRALNLNEIRKQVGHENEKTTLGNYCFNRLGKENTERILEETLSNDNKERKYQLQVVK